MIDDFFVSIESIIVAHKFTLNAGDICDYTSGRKFCGLIYVIEGEASYITPNGKTFHVGQNDLIFVSAQTAYQIKIKDTFKHYTVNFYASPQKSYGEKINELLRKNDIVIRHKGDNTFYIQIFEKLCSCWERKKVGYSMTAMRLLYELFSNFLLENYYNNPNDLNFKRILPAKKYIDQYFDTPTSIDHLANLCDMSRTNFRRIFFDVVGQTPMEYRASVCILRAKDLLACEIYSVNEVGRKCGFEDCNYFCRFFKKHVGLTPGEYKASIINR